MDLRSLNALSLCLHLKGVITLRELPQVIRGTHYTRCPRPIGILDMTSTTRDCDKDVETPSWFKGGAVMG